MNGRIQIDDNYFLSAFQFSDAERLADAIGDEEIAKNTLTIPFPYCVMDAEWWLANHGIAGKGEMQRTWAIRNSQGEVCGGIGFHQKYGAEAHKDEIGYWLMKSLWGQGLMTKAVKAFCDHIFEKNIFLVRLEAPIFARNKRSAQVLIKNGFKKEGTMRKAYLKNGEFLDAEIYAKVKGDTI